MPRLTGERPTHTSTSAASTIEPSAKARPTASGDESSRRSTRALSLLSTPALRKRLGQRRGRPAILAGQELGEHLNDRHPHAQLREDRGELTADHPTADDGQALGQGRIRAGRRS